MTVAVLSQMYRYGENSTIQLKDVQFKVYTSAAEVISTGSRLSLEILT